MAELVRTREIYVPCFDKEKIYEVLTLTFGTVSSQTENNFSMCDDKIHILFTEEASSVGQTIKIKYQASEKIVGRHRSEAGQEQFDNTTTTIDSLVDSVLLLLLSNCGSYEDTNDNSNSLIRDTHNTEHAVEPEKFAAFLLNEQFGNEYHNGVIVVGKYRAVVDLHTLRVVESNSGPLRGRVESVLAVGRTLRTPLC